MTRQYLDQAMAGFSGYIAADELYDGPYCILSIVDNRTYRRLVYEVLDHKPREEDVVDFFRRFWDILRVRELSLKGITTDASPLYPGPIARVFGPVSHQICQFHAIHHFNSAVIKTLAQTRRQFKDQLPATGRGRPRKEDRRLQARKKRLEARVAGLFEHRYLFVQHNLTPPERRTLQRITRGLPRLRVLRQIVDQVYALFDRRCRMETALAKLVKLRQRVVRFKDLCESLKPLFTPTLEKALLFLDNKMLPTTSNAVERGNRRHRKMQKSVYRVRTGQHIRQRIALDMQRESQAITRTHTMNMLHQERTPQAIR